MDPTLLQVLIGVVSNAFSSVLEKSWAGLRSFDADAAVDAVARQIMADDLGDVPDLDRTIEFLESPEATTFVRMLFVAGVHDATETSKDLELAFARLYGRYVPSGTEDDAGTLFDLLAASAERLLHVAAREGDPRAGEAIAAVRFRHLAEELQGLKRTVDTLQFTADAEIDAFLDWEKIYREQVLVRHGTITPPSFDTSERVPVDDIYVEPSFRPNDSSVPDELSRDELVQRLDRTVVLGDPGAGKSTFAMKLAYDLARNRVTVPGGSLTPLVVILKDYGSEKENGRVSLVEWIEAVVKSDYAAPPPPGAIHYLLAAGRVAVVLDGLDELLDTSYRREIAADIETFAARYVSSPMLVTSRRVGYAQAPLDPRRFGIAFLSELDEGQIAKYADLWFGLRRELTKAERTQMSQDFMRDSAHAVADLRRNTLMLALLCNIYRGDGYIPRHRPQVYEKCAVMLFERWDRGRRIEVKMEFERHLRPAMQYLAFWIYSDASLQGGVTEVALIRKATEFLTERRFDDEDEARQEACNFVEFCRGRAWVFTDIGTDPDGESLYQFTHRTFLEFFAAEHLVRTHATPAELNRVLIPRIRREEWDVVAQLAYQLKDDNLDGAGDELLAGVLDDLGDDEEREVSLSFAARSLTYLVPRRQTCRYLAKVVMDSALDGLDGGPVFPTEAYAALVYADRENFDPISSVLVEEGLAFLHSDPSQKRAEIALDLICNLDLATWGRGDNENLARWIKVQKGAFESMWPILEPYLEDSRKIAYDAVIFGYISLESFLALEGLRGIFRLRGFAQFENYYRLPIAEACLTGQLGRRRPIEGGNLGTAKDLALLGSVFANQEPHWLNATQTHNLWLGTDFDFDIQIQDPALEGDALFGAFSLLALKAEDAETRQTTDFFLERLKNASDWLGLLFPWIARRSRNNPAVPLPQLPMDRELEERMRAWGDRKWSALARPDRSG